MKKREVTSREYKVMLIPEKFKGNEDELRNKAQGFWNAFSEAIVHIVTITDNTLDDIDIKREVKFYDTEDHMLYKKHSYVFRERIEDGNHKVTLKFRHRDRYISQARDMRNKDGDDKDIKFEEDIKMPDFVSLYSFSNKQKIKQTKELNKLKDPRRLFPDFKKRLGNDYDGNKEIKVVNGFTAYEIVIEGASFGIDNDPKLQCECALILWYKNEFTRKPVVAEFSFKYKDETKEKNFRGEAAQQAYNVFQILQKLTDWVDSNGPTKTSFVYNYSAL